MAVMTTHQPEGVAVEQKIQPVPSSDKMALDLDINGTTNRDETIIKSTSPVADLTKSSATSPPDHATVNSKVLEVNGTANEDAFSANQAIPTPPIEPISESQRVEETSPSAPNSSQFPDTNTTTTEVRKLSISSDAQQPEPSALPIAIDSAIDTAVEDVAATSTVPPVVDAQLSDLRYSETSPLPADATQPHADLDFNFGPDREQDLFSDNKSIEADTQAQSEPLDISLPDLPDSVGADGVNNLGQAQVEAAAIEQEGSSAPNATTVNDTPMLDVPMIDASPQSQPPKVARERDEDGDDNLPSAKRTKTEELNESRTEMSAGVPYQNGDGHTGRSDGPRLTDHERREYSKIVKNATRTNSGKNFKDAVTVLWPALAEGYLAKIAHPVDLGLIDRKLKEDSYANLQEFKTDVHLIYDNCVTFNGADHDVTKSARVLRDSVFEKIRSIPPPPAPVVKKEKKQKATPDPAARAAASRRQSKETAPKPVQPAAPAAPTFALDPTTNTPLIRRDSTKNADGGRPKREIHPPKNKDLPYSAVKPKNKKFATELKFCDDVLGELKKPKHWAMNSVFAEPVDPVALNIPNYFTVIKFPMDLRTIQGKLDEGQYGSAKDFEKDMRLMIANCLKFNPAGNPIHQIGVDFQNLFASLWANKEKWVAEHSPAVASPSPPPESEEDESEDDEEQDATIAAGGQSAAAARLIEEQQKLIELMSAKKKDQAQIAIQQSMIEVLKQAVASSQAAPKKQKKAKAPKAKKTASVKKEKVPVKKAGNKSQSRYMGTIEKEVISAGLSSLPDEIANEVLNLIKQDQHGVDVGDDGTLELDIDVVSNPVLWKIHGLIMKYAPEVDTSIREAMQEREVPRAPAKPLSKKKNKPMNKDDQEKNIEILQNRLKDFDRQGSGSQEPVMQTTETQDQDDSSGDDDSDSEEE